MASIRKLPSGKWNVRVIRKGYSVQTKSFVIRTDADRWARTVESEMDRGTFVCRTEAEATTLAQALERYRREVVPTKKGKVQEEKRISQWLLDPLSKRSLASLKGSDFAKWRDARLKTVSPATCVRDLALLSHVFTVARTDWGIAISNPIQAIRKPRVNNARIPQPTMAREYKSITAARYSQPSRVGMYVMSLSQQALGRLTLKRRRRRLGETAFVLPELVVTLNFRIARGTICSWRISLATVLRQQATPWAVSSACTRGAP